MYGILINLISFVTILSIFSAAAYIQFKNIYWVRKTVVVLYIFGLTIITFTIYFDIKEYNSFNKIPQNQIIEVRVNNIVDTNLVNDIVTILSKDDFTFVNHPKIVDTFLLKVFTTERTYMFHIRNTSNQGVLISRINKNGKHYVTNKNNLLYNFLKDYISDK